MHLFSRLDSEREKTFFKVEIEISISSLALSLSPVATLLFYSDFCAIKSFEFQTLREAYECRPNDSSLRRIRGRKLEIFPSKNLNFSTGNRLNSNFEIQCFRLILNAHRMSETISSLSVHLYNDILLYLLEIQCQHYICLQ